MNLIRVASNKVLRRLLFYVFEWIGYHVVAANYNSPIPFSRTLTDKHFSRTSECVGVDWNVSKQEYYMREVFTAYCTEIDFQINPWITHLDAIILNSMLRFHKPHKIAEVGSGYSTKLISDAIKRNKLDGVEGELISIDPSPRIKLDEDRLTQIQMLRIPIQDVELNTIIDCDLLFLDSTHLIKIGGDVTFEILEVVPRLKPGALIHWHDILLPKEYPHKWVVMDHNFWTEQYLLQGFLLFNDSFEILWSSSYMQDRMNTFIESSDQGPITGIPGGSSFWIRKIK